MTTPIRGPEALREHLKRKGLSQTYIADKLGITQPSVSAWLRGHSRPEPHLRDALAILTGIPGHYWATDEELGVVERARLAAPDTTEGAQ
jgi:transcriptional regulator with XRE-family HTH domain